MKEQRRQFIKKMIAGGVAASTFPHLLFGNESTPPLKGARGMSSTPPLKGARGMSSSSTPPLKGARGMSNTGQDAPPVRIALIGKGGMGTSDTNTSLQVPGVKLVAVCDLYDMRLQAAKREWGDHIAVTREYKDILSRNDVDAVIIGTSDHWHQIISIEAMKAGKHVLCEKPMAKTVEGARKMLEAAKKTGKAAGRIAGFFDRKGLY